MGYSLTQISEQLGYCDSGHASRSISKARERILKPAVSQHVAVQIARLDYIALALMEIKQRQHVVVQSGKVVRDDTGVALRDVGPELECLRQLRAVGESTRKLLGLDAAVKLDITMDGLSEVDKSILDLVETMQAQQTASEQSVKRGGS